MGDWISYDEVADVYERVHAPRLALPYADLLTMADADDGSRLLDVGTGTGLACRAAAETVRGLAVGVDLSVGMLVAGHRRRPDSRLAAASAIDLPFRNGTFDVVTANFVISHFPSYATGLADMIRILRPGGRVAVSSWSDDQDQLQATWGELVEQVVPRELLEPVWKQAAPWHDRFRDRTKLEETLIDAELRDVRSERREYRFEFTVDEYVSGLEAWATGRFVREMLGDDGWAAFAARVRERFTADFSDPLHDFRTVLLAVGTKP